MAVESIFCCSFECGLPSFAPRPHWTDGGTASISTLAARSGARGARINPTAGTGWLQSNLTLGGTLYVPRVYFKPVSDPTSDAFVCGMIVAGTPVPVIGLAYKSSDGKYYPALGVSGVISFGSTGITLADGEWHCADMRFNVAANPWVIEVSVDGTVLATFNPSRAASTIDNLMVGNPTVTTTMDFYYDDAILSATSGDYPIGQGEGKTYIPTSDGAHNVAGSGDFKNSATNADITNATTDAYTLVDDIPLESSTPSDFINLAAPPNATDYVEVVFGLAPDVAAPTLPPQAVEVVTVSSAASNTTNNLRLALNDHGTTDDVRNATVGSTACVYDRKHYAVAPTAVPWVLGGGGDGDFTNLRMRCYSSDPAPDAYFVGAMIEADFPIGGSTSESASASASPSGSSSESASPSASPSPSSSPSASPSTSPSSSESASASGSASASSSLSPSLSESASPSQSPSASASVSPSSSESASASSSPSTSSPVTFEPICYNFSASTAESDPGDGEVRFNRAIQNTTDRIIIDNRDAGGIDQTATIDGLESPPIQIRVAAHNDANRWIRFQVGDVENLVFFRVINVTEISSSSASPFNDGELVCLSDAAHSPSPSPSTSASPSPSTSASPSSSTSGSPSSSLSPSASASFSFPPCTESGEAAATFVPGVWNGVTSGLDKSVPSFTVWNGVTSGSAVATFVEVPCS